MGEVEKTFSSLFKNQDDNTVKNRMLRKII